MTNYRIKRSERKMAGITDALHYAATILSDFKTAVRSLGRAPTLWASVALTLALGIGVNSAIFSVVRGVLLRPLINRDEDRLVYIQQSAPGMQVDNATFSVPEISDISSHLKTISKVGTFSTVDFSTQGLGETREIHAGVVDGAYFDVMGLKPVRGRLLDARDNGPAAPGAVVLTHKFWATTMHSDPNVLGEVIRLGSMMEVRSATIVGALEPSIPYPANTDLIANIVTSPHHLSATMVEGREHRMTDVFGRLAPDASLKSARAELRTVYSAMVAAHPDVYKSEYHFQIDAKRLREQINGKANTVLVQSSATGYAPSNCSSFLIKRPARPSTVPAYWRMGHPIFPS